ncbi:MAG: hypothetical protein K8J31_28225, partial [Anaerolineae bacterium]|nr:hypothetical protein [Anaerolineae bacterium]
GIALMLGYARRYVDYSISALLVMPLLAVLTGIVLSFLVMNVMAIDSFWPGLIVKIGLFILVYVGLLLALDRPQMRSLWLVIRQYGLFVRRSRRET